MHVGKKVTDKRLNLNKCEIPKHDDMTFIMYIFKTDTHIILLNSSLRP